MLGRIAATTLSLFLLLSGAPAFAIDLDGARSQGLVGERVDGFVGAVPANPSPEIEALVKEINQARRKHYKKIAEKNGTEFDVVAARAGQKLVSERPEGEFIAGADGRWKKKKD